MQARVAIDCAREWLRDLFASGDQRGFLMNVRKLYDLAHYELQGLIAYDQFGLDAFAAVPGDTGPPEFQQKDYPQKLRWLQNRRDRHARVNTSTE